MTRTERCLRLLRLTFACAALASTLAGCGGGGGGSSPTPPPPPPPPPATESSYLLAEFVAVDSNQQAVHVWDPARPAVAIQDVPLVQGNGIVWTSSHLVFSDATRYDPATRTFTTLGHAKVFYDNDGKLYAIDLRGGQSHVPVQLSSAVDVFIPDRAVPMNAAGDDAWVEVEGGSHRWAIRTTMNASAAPVSIQQIVAPLRDASTGLPQLFFASLGSHIGSHATATTYELADASFTRVPQPDIDAMVATDGWLGVDPAQPSLGYVRIGGQARALHWNSMTASIDATSLYAFTGFAGPTVADAQAAYFCDSDELHALANGIERLVGTFTAQPATLVDAGHYIAALEATGVVATQASYQLETMAKASGAVTFVEPTSATLQVLGAAGDTLVLVGTPEQGAAFILAQGGGTGARVAVGGQAVGVVVAASAQVDQPAATVAMLWCAAGTVDGQCGAGALVQQDLAGTDTPLGTFATAGWSVSGTPIAGLVSALGVQTFLGSDGGFGAGETDKRDAWQFMPATAGSLARITSHLP